MLEKYNELFDQHPGIITGYWVGWRSSGPYVMVTVGIGRVKDAEKLVPDKLEGLDVYYMEGETRLARSAV
jgi:hypothetical protein